MLTQEEVIKKFKEVHGDKYDYSKVNYTKTKEKVEIICKEHGPFWQRPSSHRQGYGCSYCGERNRTKTTEQFIIEAKEVHGEDKYDYSKVEYTKSNGKVCIICPTHGEFWQIANNHLKGARCPMCFPRMKLLTTEEFIKKSKELYGSKFDYSLANYTGSGKKICLICTIDGHGEFWQTPGNHFLHDGCPICRYENVKSKTRLGLEVFIEKSKKIHGDKYDYSKVVYINSATKVEIYCNACKKYFWQIANSHLQGQGCMTCAIKSFGSTLKLTQEEVIARFKEIHGDKYDYSKVVYINSYSKVIITCPEHGDFEQMPSSHISGQGCWFCGYIKNTLTKNDFIKKSIQIHGDKYDYSKALYLNANSKIKIYCKMHKKYFWQLPSEHMRGRGCPICNESKGEKKIRVWLEENDIKYIPQYRIKDCRNSETNCILPFDFAIFDKDYKLNCLLEYQGNIHYIPHSFNSDKSEETMLKNLKELQYRDNIKKKYCKDNEIKLLEIRYNQFPNIEKILNKELRILNE